MSDTAFIEAKVLEILNEEVVPAQGCTEPIAIAFTAAKAREILDEPVCRVAVKVSGNMIITPPINNLNYVIILDGKNRRKKIITKRVV